MQSPLKSSAVVMLLVAALSLPFVALAQKPPAPAGQTGQGNVHGPMARVTPDRVEQRIADLHAKLHITPDQQAQWDQFAQVMRDNAQHMRQTAEDRATKINSMNASDNMLSYAQLAMQHAQGLQSLATAFQPLYASFSPEQQGVADTMFRDVGMRHMRKAPHK